MLGSQMKKKQNRQPTQTKLCHKINNKKTKQNKTNNETKLQSIQLYVLVGNKKEERKTLCCYFFVVWVCFFGMTCVPFPFPVAEGGDEKAGFLGYVILGSTILVLPCPKSILVSSI